MNFLQYLKYIKKIGFRNYWYYLRLKNEAEFFGVELPDYDETIKRLYMASKIIYNLTPTIEEFSKRMIDNFKAMKK